MKPRFIPDASAAPTPEEPTTPAGAPEVKLDEHGFQIVKLGEYGAMLPVGVETPAGRVRPFRLRPFRLKEEKALAKLKAKKNVTMGMFLTEMLVNLVQTLGPYNFDTMNDGDKRLAIGQLSVGDALYVYLYLRYEALGADEPLSCLVSCKCGHESTVDGDLGTTEVRTVPDGVTDMSRKFKLRHGLAFKGKSYDTLILKPMVWYDWERITVGGRVAQTGPVIKAALKGIEGVDLNPFAISDEELDELSKFDYEGVVAAISNCTPGPQMVVKATCPSCSAEIATPIDWGYDSFFSRSSQLTRSTT